jgi:2-methylcitrate dehydratase PrpD
MTSQGTALTGGSAAGLGLPRGLTADLVDLIRGIDVAGLPTDQVRHARHSIADTLGVAALGSSARAVRMLRQALLDQAADPGSGRATVIGPGAIRADPMSAAMINGLASHILDFDDAQAGGDGGHFSASIVPAVLALAESDAGDVSGAEAIAATVCGHEMAARINRLLTDEHYYRGFHVSGTAGAFGVAAAACKLLGLSPEDWLMALGIAGSMASGVLGNFGSMTKPLHAGIAARAGILAARLARAGFTGSGQILEHDLGFVATHTGRANTAAALVPLGQPWALDGMLYKFNGACSGTHSAGDGMRRLVAEHGFTAGDVEHATIAVPRIQTEVANIQWPVTVEQAKFSIRFMAAAGLLGINTAESFPAADSQIADPAVQSVIGRIEVTAMPGVDRGGSADIRVRLANGQVHEIGLNSIVPIDDLDAEWAAVSAKFCATAGTLWHPAAVQEAAGRLASFENETSVRGFLAELTRR